MANGIYYIYCINNKINGKKYIGQTSKTIEHRFNIHKTNARKKYNTVIYDAINKWGIDNFEIYELEKCYGQDFCSEREMYWIKFYKTIKRKYGYNMTEGGDKCNKLISWSEKQKRQLYKIQSKSRKRAAMLLGVEHFNQLPENKKKIKDGKKLSVPKTFDEKQIIADKISKTLKKGHYSPPKKYWVKKGTVGFFKGCHHSSISKGYMSVARKGKTYEQIFGVKKSKEVKDKMSKIRIEYNNKKHNNLLLLKIKILEYISNNKESTYMNIGKNFDVSPHFIRNILKAIKIFNFQMFKMKYKGDWKSFFTNIIKNIKMEGLQWRIIKDL